MKYSIIDIGSNSVRQAFYNVNSEKFSRFFSEKNMLGILNYIENDTLSNEGIVCMCDILKNMILLSEMLKCDKNLCFSTASLRNISNRDSVVDYVTKNLNLNIEPLSGDMETYYDFLSLKSKDITNGLGLDLGGGSGQIFVIEDGNLGKNVSLPIGCLKLYKKFVKGITPKSSERKNISEYVKDMLNKESFIKNNESKNLYVMGGSGRAIAKIHKMIISDESLSNQHIDGYKIKTKHLSVILDSILNIRINGLQLLNKIVPERIHTIIPAIMTIKFIAKIANVKNIIIIDYGVREGYLIDKIIKKKDDKDEDQ